MDNMFLYQQTNGVPQESKLATYMKRASPSVNSLSNNLNSLSLDQTSQFQKVLAQSTEFVPSNLANSSSSNSSPNFHLGNAYVSPVRSPANAQTLGGSPLSHAASQSPPPKILHPTPVQPTTAALSTYQENVGGTTYFYPTPMAGSAVTSDAGPVSGSPLPETANAVPSPNFYMYPGTPSHLTPLSTSPVSSPGPGKKMPPAASSSFYVADKLRNEIAYRNTLTMALPDQDLNSDLPTLVDNYHELCPLEPASSGTPKVNIMGYQTSSYKATHSKTGVRYCLRRIHGFRLPSTKCMTVVDAWKRLQHSNIVQLREVFTTKAFNDHSMIFVYDFHPGSETLLAKHFSPTGPDAPNGYADAFSNDPNAPRPYSHQKNTLLRAQHSSLLPEGAIWNFIIQVTAALRVIHAAGLACRALDPTKIILTARSRLRLSCAGVMDVLAFDANVSNPQAHIPHYQQEDLCALGKLVLALACKSLISVQPENIKTSLDLVGRTYSSDLRNLIVYLLTNQQRRSLTDLMPMIGARFYTQLDTMQIRGDVLENELAKEMENGRICRLLTKLGTINERPELNLDPTWAETGDRYMLKLFRDYVFHQVTEDGRPWIDMAHVVTCLNKLDAGVNEKICLMSHDEQSVLVVTYAELKQCLETSFEEVFSASVKPDTR